MSAMRRWKPTIFYLLLVTGACSFQDSGTKDDANGQAMSRNEIGTPETLLGFVQSFYDWYRPLTADVKEAPAWRSVLQYKKSALTPELARALEADLETQAAATGELVGLDADPFLNSQDPCMRYEAGKASQKGESYLVDIHAVCLGNRSEAPVVVAELLPKGSSWVFVNFHYPKEKGDLLTMLKRVQ
jgi:hypothetical protein